MTVTPQINMDFTILIADEKRDSRDFLRHVIAPEGFRLQEASSSEEALALVAALPIHLFLCDQRFQQCTGLETVQQARRVRWELPCILLADQADDQLMRTALDLHVFSILSKPINRNDLLHTTRRALQRTYPAGFATARPHLAAPQGDLES